MTPKYTAYPTRQPTELEQLIRDREVRELRQETMKELRLITRRS